eukprot:ctg_2822.g359
MGARASRVMRRRAAALPSRSPGRPTPTAAASDRRWPVDARATPPDSASAAVAVAARVRHILVDDETVADRLVQELVGTEDAARQELWARRVRQHSRCPSRDEQSGAQRCRRGRATAHQSSQRTRLARGAGGAATARGDGDEPDSRGRFDGTILRGRTLFLLCGRRRPSRFPGDAETAVVVDPLAAGARGARTGYRHRSERGTQATVAVPPTGTGGAVRHARRRATSCSADTRRPGAIPSGAAERAHRPSDRTATLERIGAGRAVRHPARTVSRGAATRIGALSRTAAGAVCHRPALGRLPRGLAARHEDIHRRPHRQGSLTDSITARPGGASGDAAPDDDVDAISVRWSPREAGSHSPTAPHGRRCAVHILINAPSSGVMYPWRRWYRLPAGTPGARMSAPRPAVERRRCGVRERRWQRETRLSGLKRAWVVEHGGRSAWSGRKPVGRGMDGDEDTAVDSAAVKGAASEAQPPPNRDESTAQQRRTQPQRVPRHESLAAEVAIARSYEAYATSFGPYTDAELRSGGVGGRGDRQESGAVPVDATEGTSPASSVSSSASSAFSLLLQRLQRQPSPASSSEPERGLPSAAVDAGGREVASASEQSAASAVVELGSAVARQDVAAVGGVPPGGAARDALLGEYAPGDPAGYGPQRVDAVSSGGHARVWERLLAAHDRDRRRCPFEIGHRWLPDEHPPTAAEHAGR